MVAHLNKDIVLVIPARGGSKGIPEKNLARVGGMPLVARAVRAGVRAGLIDRVLVSTDCDHIAACAREYGAEVVSRPTALSGDTSTSESCLVHVLEYLEIEGKVPEILVMVQCTAPFITPDDVDGTVQPLLNGLADSAFAACRFKHYVWRRSTDGSAEGVSERKGQRKRRQDAETHFLEAGSVYAMKVSKFLEQGHRFCGRTVIHEVPAGRCFEIDTPDELARARGLALELDRANAWERLPDRIQAIVFDFDGVMTDDRVLVDQDGKESVFCSREDGLGIERLRAAGYRMLVLSKERNPVVSARCRKLDIEVFQGRDGKLTDLKSWARENGFDHEQLIYMGNDINDMECMEWAGLGVAPSDAQKPVLAKADLVLSSRGGRGAVRELADLVIESGK